MPRGSVAENKLKYYNFFRFSPIFVWIHAAILQILGGWQPFPRIFSAIGRSRAQRASTGEAMHFSYFFLE